MHPECGLWMAANWKKTMTSQFADMASSPIFFWHCLVSLVMFSYWSKFHSISWLVLELWQFSFIKHWPKLWKLETPLSKFFPISGDWGELEIPNLAQLSLMNVKSLDVAKCQGYSFYRFWVIKGKSTGSKITLPPISRLIRLAIINLTKWI